MNLGQVMPRLRSILPIARFVDQPYRAVSKKFKEMKKLGQGAFGAAYSAKIGNQKVIVKTAVGTPGMVSREEAAQTMVRETEILGKLQKYPFVPKLIEVGPDYYVQEDVGGESMLHLLSQKGLEPRELLSAMVASGIIASVLHREGIAHNDYELRNILLTPAGVVAIDFGIAIDREKDGEDAFREAVAKDITSVLENLMLVLTTRETPESVRIMLLSTVEKYRKMLMAGQVDEDTAQKISKDLLFAVAQLGAQHVRGKTVHRGLVKVIAV